jgi:hypothetical protein
MLRNAALIESLEKECIERGAENLPVYKVHKLDGRRGGRPQKVKGVAALISNLRPVQQAQAVEVVPLVDIENDVPVDNGDPYPEGE